MDSNTYSIERPTAQQSPAPPGGPDGPGGLDGLSGLDELGGLVAAVDELAAQDRQGLTDAVRAQRVLTLRRLLDRLEGLWLKELADLDARGAAGADQGQQAPSTAAWLRTRLRMSAEAARSDVRTTRALFGGSLPETAAALVAGQISPAHAKVVADGTHQLPNHVKLDAEPVLLEIARRVDPPRLRQAVAHLCQVADPEGADRQAARRHERRGLWLSPTWAGMVAVGGLLEREAGATVLAALEPLARPAGADDARTGSQRNADALAELARRSLEGGWLPKAGGVRPQLLVTVDLDGLLGRPGSLGGDLGWPGPLDREASRRLACDGTITRVLVTRRPGHHPAPDHDSGVASDPGVDHDPRAQTPPACWDPSELAGLPQQLRAAAARLPPTLGGAPCQPLEVGRATRVVQPAQRAALAVRDRGCVFPGCDRPLAWCDAHHLHHWVEGGPTDLDNLALLCRAHHRTVHEDGWQLTRGPDGRFSATPPERRHRTA
jgi:hypothetical protein